MEPRQPDESGELRPDASSEPAVNPQSDPGQSSATRLPTEPRLTASDELPVPDQLQSTAAELAPDAPTAPQNAPNEGDNSGSSPNQDEQTGNPSPENGPDNQPANQRNDRGPRTDAPRNDRENRNRDTNRDGGPRDGALRSDTNGREVNRNRFNGNRERTDEPRDGSGRERSVRNGPERDSQPRDAGGSDGQSAEYQGREDRLVIGISLGDYNGIGPEVILKALQHNRLQKLCTPVIYGSMRVLNRYRNLLNLKDWNLNGAPTIQQISHKLTNVITCWPDQNQDIQPGQVTPEAGQAAFACLQRAVDDLKDGKLDALVTAPINKYNIQSEEFKFPGHTEYLAEQFGVADNLMFMVSDTLRVGVVTGHVPLGRVRQNVTRERINQKLTLMMQSLKQDFGIEKPKIAVLGLNPHAGEEGLLGNEEQDIIKPLLAEWRNKGQLVFGPYPADGFFGTRGYTKFDAVLAMYHDQGLIPFKTIAFEEGVNFTAGMPAVRTSPDHGTAYDIAGKNLADETSMLRAIYTAIDVARQRKESVELEANALK